MVKRFAIIGLYMICCTKGILQPYQTRMLFYADKFKGVRQNDPCAVGT